MLFFTISAIATAMTTTGTSVATSEETHPTVASLLTSINAKCLTHKCMDSIHECDEGSACHKKLTCIKGEPDLSDAVSCFNDVKWPHLDNGMVQILDCGQHEKCMPMSDLGISLLETEMKARDIPSMAQKASLMEIRDAIESKLHGHMMQAANSMMMMKAHLMYMEAAGKAVKETTSLIQEVAKDETLAPEEKLQALDHLAGHLAQIQSDVQSQQSKIASLAELTQFAHDPEEDHMDAKAKAEEAEERAAKLTPEEAEGKADTKEAKADTKEAKETTDAKAESTQGETGHVADGNLRHDPPKA